ncbi:MAG: hypothetical protein A3F17_08345 [Gammaproteobacteria bacterium RIFCSPHIGHO2_12_FULL_41_15]|nr:MAG: hypothetical protein A3F17_08345 [Gammaproteobacteria bacterium RIFCSPHIGHO2_12_FULL_41_15]
MKKFFQRYFFPGLLVWLPILVTYFIIKFIVDMLDGTVALLPKRYQPEQLLGFHVPGTGVALTFIIVLLTGMIASNFFGRQLVALWDSILNKIPFIRGIHSATKQVLQAFLEPHNQAFRQVLLIEYPRRDIWSIAFKTSDEFIETPIDEDMMTVFVPTTPNPTSGLLTIIPKEDVIELNLSVEDALKMIISLGVVTPGDSDSTPEKTKKSH